MWCSHNRKYSPQHHPTHTTSINKALTIRCSITHHKLGFITLEVANDCLSSGGLSDVSLQLCHTWQWCHRLQVHCHNLHWRWVWDSTPEEGEGPMSFVLQLRNRYQRKSVQCQRKDGRAYIIHYCSDKKCFSDDVKQCIPTPMSLTKPRKKMFHFYK